MATQQATIQIVATYVVDNPRNAALATSAVLAADKGVASVVEPLSAGFRLVADDGKAIVFLPAAPAHSVRLKRSTRRLLTVARNGRLILNRAEVSAELRRRRREDGHGIAREWHSLTRCLS